ncbi:MAG: GNAT family N-acetyltransferase, partial [Thermoplasmata archaeon]
MPAATVTLRPTIDRPWLEAAARSDPVAHAYALWDLDRFPTQVQFVSAVRGEVTVGYLLVWLGRPATPIVHWFGPEAVAPALAEGLPPRPLIAVVPVEIAPLVERARGPTRTCALISLVARPGDGPSEPAGPSRARRLTRNDRVNLVALTSGESGLVPSEYPQLDPAHEAIWGVFEGERLRGVAQAVVRLPTVWVLGGVYVDPAARGRGFGGELVRAVVGAAEQVGAPVALYVREDRSDARAMYARAGFRPYGRRVWVDAG